MKQNINKSFWKKIWSTSSLSVMNVFTLALIVEVSQFVVEKNIEHRSSIILRSCTIWIALTLLCLPIHNKHFSKYSTALEFETTLWSWLSSSPSPLLSSSKEDCPITRFLKHRGFAKRMVKQSSDFLKPGVDFSRHDTKVLSGKHLHSGVDLLSG